MDVAVRTYSGGSTGIDEAAITAFRTALRGTLCLPDDPGYDTARSIWNGMIDRRPAMIVQAAGAADVMQTVNFARDHGFGPGRPRRRAQHFRQCGVRWRRHA